MDSIDPPEGGAELNFDTHLLGLIAPFDFVSGANAATFFKRTLYIITLDLQRADFVFNEHMQYIYAFVMTI